MLTKAQKTEALAILAATYPGAKPALDFTSPFELLKPDDLIHAWRARMLDLFDGMARKTPVVEAP